LSPELEFAMRRMRLVVLAGLLAPAAALFTSRPGAAPPTAPTLELVSYTELGKRVEALKGRVVVVDFWGDFCPPCKREFPRLVELNAKYSARGLAAVSVSLDDPADPDARLRVQRFLSDRKAAFANFLLDEKPALWQARLKIDGPPCVFIFDRRGRLMKKYHDDVDYAAIERLVVDLLN
jgi:thiol-disulfide isomerase/thioredoxin